MSTEKSKNNWVKRGFGWIPDLPDIADPDLSSALSHKTQILTREGAGHIEEIAAHLIDILNNENLADIIGEDESLKEAQKKLLGETYFPNVQIYKILRKGAFSQEREVMKLRKALYLIYSRSLIKSKKDDFQNHLLQSFISVGKENAKDGDKDTILPKGRIKLVHWLQDQNFDENLEQLVKAFQSGVGLLSDGIVGLRTYSAIEDLLSEDEKILQEVNLLCPTSLIPHEILEEIFEHLSFLWLHGKFRYEIQNAFQCFCDSYPLSVMQVEKVRQTQQELEGFLSQQLKDINKVFRDSIEELSSADSDNQHQDVIAINEHVNQNLISKLVQLQISLVEKSGKILQENREATVTKDHSALHQDPSFLAKLQEAIQKNLSSFLNDQTLFTNNFIVCSKQDFADQFHLWSHLIEPFTSAFLQILSPLADFDNFKEAVKVGFERLDSCFQFHHLESRSRLTAYKNLLYEYSPNQLSDQMDSLKILRESVAELFNETLVKIDRQREDDLNFREAIIDCLIEFLTKSVKLSRLRSCRLIIYLSSTGFQLLSRQEIIALYTIIIVDLEEPPTIENPQEEFLIFVQSELDSKYKDKGYKNKDWEEKIKSAAITIFTTRTNVLDGCKVSLKKKVDLTKEKVDISKYLGFFKFLEDILDKQYGVNLGSIQENLDNIKSLLSTKKELFEILSTSPLISGDRETVPESDKSLFFEPITLQLPVSAELIEEPSATNGSMAKSYFFLPGVVDLSYWCSPVEDQEESNACTAFAGVALVEYFFQKRYEKYVNLSIRFLYKTARNLMNRSDDTGASVRQTMKALVLFGVPPSEAWPWKIDELDEEPPAFCYAYAQSYQTIKSFRLDASNITSKELLLFQIKAVLAAGLPCIFGFTIYSSFYKEKNIRRGHIPFPSGRDQVLGGHAAIAVGYNDYKHIDRVDGEPANSGAILIRNSWGTDWGNGGYGWLPYDYILEGLTADWWSLLKSEWFDGGAFGLGAVDPGKPPKRTDPRRRSRGR